METINNKFQKIFPIVTFILGLLYFLFIWASNASYNLLNKQVQFSILYLILTTINIFPIFSKIQFFLGFFKLIKIALIFLYIYIIYSQFKLDQKFEDIVFLIKICCFFSFLIFFTIYDIVLIKNIK